MRWTPLPVSIMHLFTLLANIQEELSCSQIESSKLACLFQEGVRGGEKRGSATDLSSLSLSHSFISLGMDSVLYTWTLLPRVLSVSRATDLSSCLLNLQHAYIFYAFCFCTVWKRCAYLQEMAIQLKYNFPTCDSKLSNISINCPKTTETRALETPAESKIAGQQDQVMGYFDMTWIFKNMPWVSLYPGNQKKGGKSSTLRKGRQMFVC